MKTTDLMEQIPTNQYPIIGKSKAVENIRKQISRLARSRNDILLVGEGGVGKGAIAKNIHYQGSNGQTDSPFVSVNLSVIDDKEMEAILFGFERGAERLPYTSKRGIFELANGGAVLIEELEEASFRNQLKIMTLLNDRKTRRIGGAKSAPVDIRLIVTLKEEPKNLFEKRKIIPELYEKLSEFEVIYVPPLRERAEDIPLLVKYFVGEIGKELALGDIVIDINAIDVLVKQSWRENIRELKAVVDKSVLFSQGGRFTLPPELVDEKTEVVKMINNIIAGQEFILDRSLDMIERGIIERALDRFGLNQSKAAQFLGMTEQTLRYKLRRLGIASSHQRV
ncbi:MAG TPA: sigma 54-interacting transcriptional regulator [Bacteroidota bacterium]|nr:sigma 54-interacting transcriptional regulator [Bacteroidota bacterium]